MWVFRHFWGFLGLFRGFLGVGTAGGVFWGENIGVGLGLNMVFYSLCGKI
jgi:hypothetical protein